MTPEEKPAIGPESKKALKAMWDVTASVGRGVASAVKAAVTTGYRDGMARWKAREATKAKPEPKEEDKADKFSRL